ncbi:MAG: hypothetical protein RR253_01000 [Oscillospiraceae bacterium]
MHGLQHKVIEINVQNSDDIERILVFLRPGEHKINVANTRQEAQELLSQFSVVKTKVHLPKWIKFSLIGAGIFILFVGIVVIII